MIHQDLQVIDRDIVFNGLAEPFMVQDDNVIAQDIFHRLSDNGYPINLIGDTQNADTLSDNIKELVEEDERIYPGNVEVVFTQSNLSIAARMVSSSTSIQITVPYAQLATS